MEKEKGGNKSIQRKRDSLRKEQLEVNSEEQKKAQSASERERKNREKKRKQEKRAAEIETRKQAVEATKQWRLHPSAHMPSPGGGAPTLASDQMYLTTQALVTDTVVKEGGPPPSRTAGAPSAPS